LVFTAPHWLQRHVALADAISFTSLLIKFLKNKKLILKDQSLIIYFAYVRPTLKDRSSKISKIKIKPRIVLAYFYILLEINLYHKYFAVYPIGKNLSTIFSTKEKGWVFTHLSSLKEL